MKPHWIVAFRKGTERDFVTFTNEKLAKAFCKDCKANGYQYLISEEVRM